MPKPITNELREKIIRHKQNVENNADISCWLFVSQSAVSKIWKSFLETGKYELQYKNCGWKSAISIEQETSVLEEYVKTLIRLTWK